VIHQIDRQEDALSDTTEPALEGISMDELRLAARNHGMPLEALRYDLTPVGLHYLLIHFDIPDVDADGWQVTIDGDVERPASVSLDEIVSAPAVTVPVTMECAGNGRARLEPRPISQPWLDEAVGTAAWTGTPLRPFLERAVPTSSAIEVVFTGADHGTQGDVEQDYQRSLPLDEAMRDDVLLVWAMNGQPLAPQHGFPLRLLVPGWYGMTNVKWLSGIELVSAPFDGFQQEAYRLRADDDDHGTAVTRIQPRALMVPPGDPDFLTRERFVGEGRIQLEGRAWSGLGPIVRVEVSTDDGASWADATIEPPPAPYAWSSWRFEWNAGLGHHRLRARATDETGATQPDDPPWNAGGFSNTTPQVVPVSVR
jgi:DMSO/TMAO reductase YedYZ molybdopterin-dependent catalytic subunit